MKRRRRWNFNRAGVSLVEMMVVIATLGVVLGSIAMTLHRIYRIDTDVRGELDQMVTTSRLAHQFRQDAHAAASAYLPSNDRIVFQIDAGPSVEYRSQGNSIHRTKHKNEDVLHRDSFSLPDSAQSSWQIVDTGGRPMAALIIEYPVGPEADLNRVLRFEAVIGMLNESEGE